MAELLVIADDLTGALDSGVQLASKGDHVLVSLDCEGGLAHASEADVIVIDSESRHDTPQDAYRKVSTSCAKVCRRGVTRIYKKTDSGLRGNVGAELAAVIDAVRGNAPQLRARLPQTAAHHRAVRPLRRRRAAGEEHLLRRPREPRHLQQRGRPHPPAVRRFRRELGGRAGRQRHRRLRLHDRRGHARDRRMAPGATIRGAHGRLRRAARDAAALLVRHRRAAGSQASTRASWWFPAP